MTQHYENNSDTEILTAFLFPIDADLVISKVRAKFGETEIETQVNEKEEAEKMF